MDWFLHQRICVFLLATLFLEDLRVQAVEPENTQSTSEVLHPLAMTTLDTTTLPTVDSPSEADFSLGEENPLQTSGELEEFNLCIKNSTQEETWDAQRVPSSEVLVKNLSLQSSTSMPLPHCMENYVPMKKELPKANVLSCILRQSRKAARIAMDLPPNVHAHLSGGHWLGEATQLASLSNRLPPSCEEALCHPAVNVSFRVIDEVSEESVVVPAAFMAMYGQATSLLDRCREHVQALSNITKITDSEGNILYQLADHYWLIIFQNQRCHHTDSLTKISSLTTLKALSNPPSPCLQNILCSPSVYLQHVERSSDHLIWIPFTQGPLPLADLTECFQHFNDNQDRQSDIASLTITSGQAQHELVFFKNPNCHVQRLQRFSLYFILESGNIPPSSCLSLLCDQHFQLGIHMAEKTYLMAFGNDSSLLSQCRVQLSGDSRSNRTNGIKGLTFPLSRRGTFFLPDSDCFSAAFPSQAPLFLSIMNRNVVIPEPCMPLLCKQETMFHYVASKLFYTYSKPDDLAGACFEALAPNVQTDDILRILPISPKVNMFQISPTCRSMSMSALQTFRLIAYFMYSGVALPSSCYSHLCHGFVGYIESLEDKAELYYIIGSSHGQSGCYSSLLRSTLDTRIVTDSSNCSFALLSLSSVDSINTMASVSDPRCQYTCLNSFTCFEGPHVDIFFSLLRNDFTVPNKVFNCLARAMDRLYENQWGSFSQSVQNYGRGVLQRLPDHCIRLACDPSLIIGFQSEIENKFATSQAWNIYITFHSLNDDNFVFMAACNEALKSTGEDISLHSRGILIRSHISHRYSVSIPDHIFFVFPPVQCFVVQNLLKASVFSYFQTLYGELPLRCIEKLVCTPDIDTDITIFQGNSTVYLSYRKGYEDVGLSDECMDHLNSTVDFTFPNASIKLMYHKPRRLTPMFRYIIFDFSFGIQGWEEKQLITDLLIANFKLLRLTPCILCVLHSRVAFLSDQIPRRYLLVPYLDDSQSCHLCYREGDRVADFPTLVSLVDNEIQHLYMLPRNATYLTTDSEDSYEAGNRYLYFVNHRFGECARVDKGDFRTLLNFHHVNATRFYLIQREEGLPCLEQIRNSSKFSCFEGKIYVLCHENEASSSILYLYGCHFMSSAKFEKLSNLILDSLKIPNTFGKKIQDLCAPETHVTSYVIPGDLIYYETVGRTSNLNHVLASLQSRWRLRPKSVCIILFTRTFRSCSTAYNAKKIDEIVQSQTGVAMQNSKRYRVIYQCILFSHPNATLRLYRLISATDFMSKGENDICNKSFEIHEQKFFSTLQNGALSIEPEIARSSRELKTVSNTASQQLNTSSCPALKNDINIDFITVSVVHNNSACLQDLCTGNFIVSNETEGEVSLIGPLFISMYRSPCFKAIPPQVWRRVNRAFVSGRATLNKFWPGCFYDYIVISTSKDAKIDDWTYLPAHCKVREITYFTGSLILTIITIVGNLVVIYTLFYHAKMNDASCRLRVNLAFADLLVGLFVQSRALHNHLSLMTGALTLHQLDELGIYDNFEEDLETSAFGFSQIRFIRTGFDAFCGFVFSVSSFVSLTFMSLMTLERYLMVVHQRHHGKIFKNPSFAWIIFGTWIGGFVFAILLLQKEDGHEFVGYFDPLSKITTSLPSNSIRSASFLAFYTTVVFFTITSLLVGVLSVLTFWGFSTNHERLLRWRIYVQDPLKPIMIKKLRVILTIFVTAYMISCVPLVMGSVLNVFLLSPTCHQIMWWIYLSSSAWNCYLYNFRLSKFRAEVLKSLYCITTTRIGRWLEDIADDTRAHLESSKNKRTYPSNKVVSGVPGVPQQITSSL